MTTKELKEELERMIHAHPETAEMTIQLEAFSFSPNHLIRSNHILVGHAKRTKVVVISNA